MRKAIAVLLAVVLTAVLGCVERKVTVTSTPPGAKVYLDDEEKGETPVTFRFNFYGDRTFMLKKDGYRVKKEVRKVAQPFWAYPPLDILTDLGPLPMKDRKKYHFDLEPITEVRTEDLLDRARRVRSRVTGEPGKEKPSEVPPSESTTEPAETPPAEDTSEPAEMESPPEE